MTSSWPVSPWITAAKALLDVSLAARKPVGFGVTGPRMSRVQAEARVASGAHAVDAVVGMLRMTAA
ncbi:MAG TPA: 6,7-dimethyl-8-ribityllumazine synthase [Candidatus Thermoplasmatota archaeon]|nr:6,7-dimethyl-8-ribityllumazine synthase [Candidatus Thermoplasmatota archaeon]